MPEIEASDGTRLYVEVHGRGLPVVLSCALATTLENWRPQVEPFVAAGARLILWDYRGHGRSGVPEQASAYSLDQVVDDLARVAAWGGHGRPAVLGGLSFGGLASLHLALRRPGSACALLLIDSGPGFKNPEAQAAWAAQVERTASFVETRGMQAFVERAGPTTVGLRPELPAARDAARAIARQDPRGIAHFARRVAAPATPVIDDLARLDLPALVVVGEKDEPYRRAAEVMETRLPRARRVTVAGAGHIVNIEAQEAFHVAVLPFIESLADAEP
jgi:pimeloyl-ACP methyl ester carboxylesterase